MGRKVSIGVVGSGGGLGTIVAGGTGNTLTTAVTNQDLIIDPNGTGTVKIIGAAQLNAQSELRLADTDSSNYIAQKAAGTIASNYTLTWPSAVTAVAGYALTSGTDGTLSWTSLASGGVAMTDPGASGTVHYPVFLTNAGAISTTQVTGFNNKSNLSFVPSTGELFSDIGRHPNVIGSASNSGTVTIRGTSAGTKATASVLMTDNVAATSTTTGTLVVTGGVGISGAVWATSGNVEGTVTQYYSENTTNASKTIQLADRDKVIACTNTTGTDITITIPSNSTVAFPIGSRVHIYRKGTGQVTIAAGAGATLNKTGTMAADEEFYVRKRDTNEWVVVDVPKLLRGAGGTVSAANGYTIHSYTSGSSTFSVA